jgi:predicted nucleotidyltransferase
MPSPSGHLLRIFGGVIINLVKGLEKIKKILIGHKSKVEASFNVKEIGVFGSYVRNEEHKGSDVDILVEFKKPVGLFRFMDLEEYLQKILGLKVDLVSKKALKPRIGRRILKEVVLI